MSPEKLLHFFAHNSRKHERLLQQAEEHATQSVQVHLGLEQEVMERLRCIASLQLEQNTAPDQQMQQVLTERQQAIAALRSQLHSAEEQVAQALDAEAALHLRIDSLDRQAQQQLGENPAYTKVARDLDQAITENRLAAAAYTEIRQECADKLPTFNQNRLYTFLRERQYATEQYRGRLFGRWCDDWLANKVNYRANRANELSLLNMQAHNEAAQSERDARLASLAAEAGEVLGQAQRTVGLAPLQAEQQNLARAVQTAKQRANEVQQKLGEFTRNEDPHFQRARQNMAELLKSRSLEQLLEDVKKTPDPSDDAIALELQSLYPRLKDAGQQAAAASKAQAASKVTYQRAKLLERAVRGERFAVDQYVYSDDFDYTALIALYMEGSLQRDQVLDQVEQHSRPASEGFQIDSNTVLQGVSVLLQVASAVSSSRGSGSSASTGSSGSSASGGFSSSDSSGGGSFRSSGSSGGGGFRTTDSF